MKYQTMIKVIAGAGLVLGSFSAMAGSGWAFDYSGATVVPQTAGSSENSHKNKTSSGGSGWAFNNPNVPEVKQGAKYSKKHSSGGVGWAFDHPHEPAQGSTARL
jgi:hypothetical protein